MSVLYYRLVYSRLTASGTGHADWSSWDGVSPSLTCQATMTMVSTVIQYSLTSLSRLAMRARSVSLTQASVSSRNNSPFTQSPVPNDKCIYTAYMYIIMSDIITYTYCQQILNRLDLAIIIPVIAISYNIIIPASAWQSLGGRPLPWSQPASSSTDISLLNSLLAIHSYSLLTMIASYRSRFINL